MNLPYGAVYFDVDGTLLDSAPGVTRCVAAALSEMGLPVEDQATLMLHVGPPLAEGFRTVSGLDADTAEEAVRRYRRHYESEGVFEASLFPGVADLLQSLRDRGVRLSTATSKTERMTRIVLDHLGVADLLDRIVGAGPERATKTAVLAEARRQLAADGFSGAEALLGDRIFDAVGARDHGIDFIGAAWGYAPDPAELRSARLVAASPAEAALMLTGGGSTSREPAGGAPASRPASS